MEQKILGRTGLKVSQLGLGGLFVSKVGGPFEDAKAAVHCALQRGINYIDTAPGYADSEAVLGRILCEVPQPLILSTKLGGRPKPFDPRSRDCLLASVDESLRLLGRKHIDILMIHEPDRSNQYDWWTDLDRFHGPVLEVLAELNSKGVISYIGIGGTTAYELPRIIETGRFDVVLTAFNYSLLWREAEIEVLPLAKKHNLGIVIGSPLQQGALARRYDEAVNGGAPWLSLPRRRQFQALYRFLDEISIPIAELAMRFVISNPDISCVLTGARSAAEVEANIAAVENGPLSREILSRLNEIAAMVPFRPFEEPFGLPFHSKTHNRVGTA
jgi:aryl-alcohol dehydrogenase-like predicted oxidoreductase